MGQTHQRAEGDEGAGRSGALQTWLRLIGGVRRERWGETAGYLFILPGLLLFFVFQIYPIYRGLILAFTDYRFMIPGWEPFVGIHNFVEMFTRDLYFWDSLKRTLLFTGIFLPTTLALALFSASMIASVKNGLVAAFFRSIIYLPVILPIAVAMLMWHNVLGNQYGLVNFVLRNVGLGSLATDWLGNTTWALPSIAIARVWRDFGFATMLLLIGMYNINREMYEAASLDGANAWQTWKSITLPQLKPVLTIVFVLNAQLVSGVQEFMLMYGAGNTGPERVGLTLGYYAYLTAFRWGDLRMGYAAALSLLLGVIATLITVIVFRTMRTERA